MEHTGKSEQSKKRRKSYVDMAADKKAELLKRRRLQYAASRASKMNVCSSLAPTVHPSFRPDESTSVASNTGTSFGAADLCNIALSMQIHRQTKKPTCAHINAIVFPRRIDAAHQTIPERLGSQVKSIIEPSTHPLLPQVNDCEYCEAKRFYHEPPSFCYSEGEVRLVPTHMPLELLRLFTSEETDAVQFRRYVRTYNNHLAFTTFGAKSDPELMKNCKGVYTFNVQGKVYHNLPPLQSSTDPPRNLQLYLYDNEPELDQRLALSTRLDRQILTILLRILQSNPYVAFLRQLKDIDALEDKKICLINNPSLDQRVYNEPTSNDVAAILSLEDDIDCYPQCHIQIYAKDALPYKISHNFACFDALQYPMLFAKGESGWHFGVEKLPPNLRKKIYKYNSCSGVDSRTATTAEALVEAEESGLTRGQRKRNIVSYRQYYCYKLQMRDTDRSGLLHGGRLLQQYIVDMFVKVESCRLDYVSKQQKEIRTEYLQGLVDSINNGTTLGASVGHKAILPPSFMGGSRYMRRRYLDAMALVQQFGKPDFFITMTCNPAWAEITMHLLPGQLPQNRPDLLS